MNILNNLNELTWSDFFYIVDTLQLASIGQCPYKDSITELPNFNELAEQYEKDDEWKKKARDAEYDSCSILSRFKTDDTIVDVYEYSFLIISKMMESGGPLSFIWNADINMEATYLFTDTEGYTYVRIDLYSDTSRYPMISNHTIHEMLMCVASQKEDYKYDKA